MPSLLALALAGPSFVPALLRAWEAGDAVAPLDPALPAPAVRRVLDALRPAMVVDPSGERHRRADGRPVEPGDALVVATSGTTGEPKGVVLTQQAVRASADATSRRLAVDPSRDRWLACLPLHHIGGLSVATRALHTGTPLVVHPRFDAAAVEEEARRGATLVSLVPTALERVRAEAFRLVLVGGAADWRERPANVVHSYGLSETGGGVAYDGRPLDGVELRLGSQDEVWVRGPMLLRSYRDGGDPKSEDGWLPTGDAGQMDEGGTLRVGGRLSEVIVTGGEKVWPEPVERVLRRHPQVADVAVAGRPDDRWGERVVAFVVPRHPSSPPTLASLRALVRQTLAPAWAPRHVVVIASIPKTFGGKVQRWGLGA